MPPFAEPDAWRPPPPFASFATSRRAEVSDITAPGVRHGGCHVVSVATASIFHEAPLDVLRARPQLLLEVLRLAGAEVPEEGTVQIVEAAVTEAVPAHRSADLVACIGAPRRAPSLVVTVEVQRRPDPEKRWSWPAILAGLGARHRAPVLLLVLCFDERTAAWARGPALASWGSLVVHPTVLGPSDLPHFTSVAEAEAHLDLAVLVALARAAGAAPTRMPLDAAALADVLHAASAVGAVHDEALRNWLVSLLMGTAPPEVRATMLLRWEEQGMGALELIREEWRREAREEGLVLGRQEGEAHGEARALLRVLAARGFQVSEAQATRVLATRDMGRLDRWLERAVAAGSLQDVFDGE